MADRYWVGGTGTWSSANTANWSTASGGAGGASVPGITDNAIFDNNSGGGTVSLSGSVSCLTFYAYNPSTLNAFTGNFAAISLPNLNMYGSFDLSFFAGTFSSTINLNFFATTPGWVVITNGKSVGSIAFNGTGGTWDLFDALTAGVITLFAGTFSTNDFNITAAQLSSSNSNVRSINLSSSTITLSTGASPLNFATTTNLTLNAGTSSIFCSSANANVSVANLTFYDITFSSATSGTRTITGSGSGPTFRNVTYAASIFAGISSMVYTSNCTITNLLTINTSSATSRFFLRSDAIGATRTLTCAAVASLADIDFRDITIAGAAAPVSGTRLGDCKGNSGVTFGAPKTVYWNLAGGGNWNSTGWAATSGASPSDNNFPLAQDIAIFESTGLNSGSTITINVAYNISTIDMSARTSNTMTLATGAQTPAIYGNWINGTGTTLTGTGMMTFAGRGSQTITSAGITFTQGITIDTPSGSVTLQDAFTSNRNLATALTVNQGTFDAATYNVTLSGATANASITGTSVRTVAIGSGTWTIAGSGTPWNAAASVGLTVTGTGTISLTSASAKTFAGGDIQTYPILNQGGAGTLAVTGSNKFANITNTYKSTSTTITFTGGGTNEFTSFSLSGLSGVLCAVQSTSTTKANLKKATQWYVGANSVDGGNNSNLTFTAGDGIDYLSFAYINGIPAIPSTSNANFFMLFN